MARGITFERPKENDDPKTTYNGPETEPDTTDEIETRDFGSDDRLEQK